ncbi:MAG TPA: hypothetical protein ENI15_13915 [Spirochaetes bacterium]|nr:hypothetical protein [Spirochaetota bacterium]
MASYIAMVAKGYFPVAGQASCVIEISPGIEINRLTDIAVKATDVKPGLQIVERLFGLLEVHSHNQGDARDAGRAVLAALEQDENNRMRPRILTSQLIKNIDPHHAQLINKIRYGNMIVKGNTLYILEIEPAGYAYYAANEAEKASHINIIEVVGFGRYGRIYIAGEEAEVLVSKEMVEKRLLDISGREPSGQKE